MSQCASLLYLIGKLIVPIPGPMISGRIEIFSQKREEMKVIYSLMNANRFKITDKLIRKCLKYLFLQCLIIINLEPEIQDPNRHYIGDNQLSGTKLSLYYRAIKI